MVARVVAILGNWRKAFEFAGVEVSPHGTPSPANSRSSRPHTLAPQTVAWTLAQEGRDARGSSPGPPAQARAKPEGTGKEVRGRPRDDLPWERGDAELPRKAADKLIGACAALMLADKMPHRRCSRGRLAYCRRVPVLLIVSDLETPE